jgi:hypothetical protein
MKAFTSYAQFKQIIQVGMTIHSVYHMMNGTKGEEGKPVFEDGEPQIREVSIKQTNAFALKTWQFSKKKWVDSWFHYPKATDCEIKDNKIMFYTTTSYYTEQNQKKELRIPMITYYFPD